MTAAALLAHLRAAGVVLSVPGLNRLKVDAPKSVLTAELRAALVTYKTELLILLRENSTHPYELHEINEFNRASV